MIMIFPSMSTGVAGISKTQQWQKICQVMNAMSAEGHMVKESGLMAHGMRA